MQIAALETLVLISRVGSFSRAAALRNMTLPALSMQMKTLEQDLGTPLFDRSFRPPRLTPAGKRAAGDALRVCEACAVLRAGAAPGTGLSGHIGLGFVPSAAVRILPEFLRAAGEVAPDAEFILSTGLSAALCDQVRTGALDAALVTDIAEAAAGLVRRHIIREEMAVVLPMGRHQADLSTLPFLHFLPQSGIGRLIAAYLRDTGLTPPRTLVLDSIEAIMTCVRNGIGTSVLPLPDVQRYAGDTVHYARCDPALVRSLSLVTRDDALSAAWRDPLAGLLTGAAAPNEEF